MGTLDWAMLRVVDDALHGSKDGCPRKRCGQKEHKEAENDATREIAYVAATRKRTWKFS